MLSGFPIVLILPLHPTQEIMSNEAVISNSALLALPKAHLHRHPIKSLAPHLVPYFPYSLQLLRCIQYRFSSPSSHVFATFSPGGNPQSSFAAAWVDRSRGPETECWVFSTYEVKHINPQGRAKAAERDSKAHLLSLFTAIAKVPNPKPTSPLLVIGTLNECLLPLLGGKKWDYLAPHIEVSQYWKPPPLEERWDTGNDGILSSISVPYMKYLVTTSLSSPEHGYLPPGYYSSKIHDSDYRKILSRIKFPKSEETLARLGSYGVRFFRSEVLATKNITEQQAPQHKHDGGELVAWVFLNIDGSLTSLHVEPGHRGKGLAKAVVNGLLETLAKDPEALGFEPLRSVRWGERDEDCSSCSDVAVNNAESTGMANMHGARKAWMNRWVGVDLGKVGKAVEGLFSQPVMCRL